MDITKTKEFIEIKSKLKEILEAKRFDHVLSVVDTALDINKSLGLNLDERQVALAALLHDCAKKNEDLYFEKYKEKYNLSDNLFDNFFNLHTILGSIVAKEEYGINDSSILSAITNHTKGSINMTKLDKLIYSADAIEPGRDYPDVDKLRRLAKINLNQLTLAVMNNTIDFVNSKTKVDDKTYLIRDSIRRDIMQEKLDIVVKACEDKIAEDIKTIEIGDKTSIADYFVITTGNSVLQTQAIANEVEEKVEKAGYEVLSKEGFRDGSWILVDLGDIIVHVFTKEKREFYNIEKLWD